MFYSISYVYLYFILYHQFYKNPSKDFLWKDFLNQLYNLQHSHHWFPIEIAGFLQLSWGPSTALADLFRDLIIPWSWDCSFKSLLEVFFGFPRGSADCLRDLIIPLSISMSMVYCSSESSLEDLFSFLTIPCSKFGSNLRSPGIPDPCSVLQAGMRVQLSLASNILVPEIEKIDVVRTIQQTWTIVNTLIVVMR